MSFQANDNMNDNDEFYFSKDKMTPTLSHNVDIFDDSKNDNYIHSRENREENIESNDLASIQPKNRVTPFCNENNSHECSIYTDALAQSNHVLPNNDKRSNMNPSEYEDGTKQVGERGAQRGGRTLSPAKHGMADGQAIPNDQNELDFVRLSGEERNVHTDDAQRIQTVEPQQRRSLRLAKDAAIARMTRS